MMSEAQHTPGPWWVSETSQGRFEVQTYRDHEDPKIAYGGIYGASIALGIGDHTEARTRDNKLANARLIAAAPDLMEACDFALTILEALGNGKGDAAMACRAALAKARGEG